jgi:hypothetical protein
MPRYFFNVFCEAEAPYLDDMGDELPNDEAAWRSALISAGQSIRDLTRRFPRNGTWRMEVLDARGNLLYSLYFRGASHTRGDRSSSS